MQESRVYKIEIWIRTDVDIRVIVSVVRPLPTPRSLDPQIVVMGEWKYLLKS